MARSDPEALVREHGAFLRRLARELARGGGGDGREGDAEDLVQETWVQALRSPPDPTRPARPWLAEVLRNLWRMRYRGAGRREAREADAEALRDAPVDPEQALSRAETLALLSDRLTKLAEPLRTTLLLRNGEGMSAAAIAALQGIPAGTVAGDRVVAVDGAGVAQLGFDGALARIRGAEGTTVILGLVRAGGSTAGLVVTRQKVTATP
ncbi:MAG TPA: sigma-70 family RNA polymerase sigma factor [Kofleriaceae bacterium]|nr:sigma-70 family RNA polymerase sigma factor [Kofleriaceae bacterium]